MTAVCQFHLGGLQFVFGCPYPIRAILRLYWGQLGIMEKKMETTIYSILYRVYIIYPNFLLGGLGARVRCQVFTEPGARFCKSLCGRFHFLFHYPNITLIYTLLKYSSFHFLFHFLFDYPIITSNMPY